LRAVSLHRDVIVVTSQLLQTHCTILRDPAGTEAFAIDSPVLPEELELLAPLVEQAGFPTPHGLLATHADFDHVLAPLAFPDATLGCAQSSAERLRAQPGAVQRELRRFDEELQIERRPLSLAAVQELAVPGRCAIGDVELELHEARGHTSDGMAIWVGWANLLVAGDYLSSIELPSVGEGSGMLDAYLATLARLQPLLARAEHVVPGHGPVIDGARAAELLAEDRRYLKALRERGADAELPHGRRSPVQRELHAQNAARAEASA
jgi:glyoxylase-like metal-dependent hydrolase (beta-lactamase superfamily II)